MDFVIWNKGRVNRINSCYLFRMTSVNVIETVKGKLNFCHEGKICFLLYLL